MPSSTSKAEQDLVALKLTVASLSALLTQLQSTLAPTSNELPTSISSNNPISPLSLAHDCASLVKAHTTKLSLLLITPPFTPSALTPILHALSTGPLPGLASSITLCSPASYTSLLSSELRHSVTRLFSTLEALVGAIPLDGTVLEKEKRDGGRGSLVGTGAVWDACDEVMGLRELGIAGICVRRVEGWRELVKDALEELREWGEGEDDGEEDRGSEDEEEEGEEDAQDILDSMFSSERHIPASDPQRIRPRLETTLKRLRLLILLYTALVKRRFNTLPLALGGSSIATIDAVLDKLKKIPDVVDELASAFYDLNPREIDVRMRECFEAGKKAAKEVEKDWKGGDDEFTAWAGKFKNSMEENW